MPPPPHLPLSEYIKQRLRREEPKRRREYDRFFLVDGMMLLENEGKEATNAFRLSDVKTLENLNFESWMEWKSSLQLTLALMDLELALYEPKPPMPTRNSSPEERAKYEKWERSNRLSLMIMKHKISSSIRSLAPESGTAGQYLARLEIMFMRFEKADAALLLNKLANMKYDGQGNVRDHIAKMSGLAARVKAGGIDIPNYFFVQLVLDSLPPQFKRLQATCVNWGLDELMCLCGEEEEFIRLENCERKISAIPVAIQKKAPFLSRVWMIIYVTSIYFRGARWWT